MEKLKLCPSGFMMIRIGLGLFSCDQFVHDDFRWIFALPQTGGSVPCFVERGHYFVHDPTDGSRFFVASSPFPFPPSTFLMMPTLLRLQQCHESEQRNASWPLRQCLSIFGRYSSIPWTVIHLAISSSGLVRYRSARCEPFSSAAWPQVVDQMPR